MTEQEYLDVLAEKLSEYLTDDKKEYDSTQMINSIITSIIQYFDCDYQKLIDALDELIEMKNSNYSTKYAEEANKFDISNTTKLSIKGFISKGHPILFFYYNDDPNPYGIVKAVSQEGKDVYSVEISNNSNALANYKKDKSSLDNCYVFVDEYEYEEGILKSTKNIYAKTVNNDVPGMFSYYDFPEYLEEYKNFLILLNNALSNSKIDISKMSGFGADILFLSFYDIVNELCGSANVLPLKDIVYLINQTIYDDKVVFGKPESDVLKQIDLVSIFGEDALQKRVCFDADVDGKNLRYEVVKSEKYLSVEVFDGDDKICGNIIVASPEGFSFFRSNTKNEIGEKFIPSFVINFSNDKIKFVTINDDFLKNKNGRRYETLISFEENGEMNISSSDEIYSRVGAVENARQSNITTFGE